VALGFPAPVRDAMALALAATVSSAIGLFPGGLGIRELLSAAVAGLTGFDPAVGLVVSAVDRIVVLVVVGLCSLVMLVSGSANRALGHRIGEPPEGTEPMEPGEPSPGGDEPVDPGDAATDLSAERRSGPGPARS